MHEPDETLIQWLLEGESAERGTAPRRPAPTASA
jgi:hypothetical protein